MAWEEILPPPLLPPYLDLLPDSQHLIHAGLNILGDELFNDSSNQANLARFNEYKYLSQELNETLKEDDDLDAALNGAGDDNGNSAQPQIDKNKIFPDMTSLRSERNKIELRKKTFYEVVNTAVIKKQDSDSSSLAKSSTGKASGDDESIELTQQSHLTRQVELDTAHLVVKDASVDD